MFRYQKNFQEETLKSQQNINPIIPSNQQSSKQITLYLRLANGIAYQIRVSKMINEQEISAIIFSKFNIPANSQILYISGHKIKSNEMLCLSDKSILHVIDLRQTNLKYINISISRILPQSKPIKFKVQSSQKIKQFIENQLFDKLLLNLSNIFLVQAGRKLNIQKSFYEQNVENNSEIKCVHSIYNLKNDMMKTKYPLNHIISSKPENNILQFKQTESLLCISLQKSDELKQMVPNFKKKQIQHLEETGKNLQLVRKIENMYDFQQNKVNQIYPIQNGLISNFFFDSMEERPQINSNLVQDKFNKQILLQQSQGEGNKTERIKITLTHSIQDKSQQKLVQSLQRPPYIGKLQIQSPNYDEIKQIRKQNTEDYETETQYIFNATNEYIKEVNVMTVDKLVEQIKQSQPSSPQQLNTKEQSQSEEFMILIKQYQKEDNQRYEQLIRNGKIQQNKTQQDVNLDQIVNENMKKINFNVVSALSGAIQQKQGNKNQIVNEVSSYIKQYLNLAISQNMQNQLNFKKQEQRLHSSQQSMIKQNNQSLLMSLPQSLPQYQKQLNHDKIQFNQKNSIELISEEQNNLSYSGKFIQTSKNNDTIYKNNSLHKNDKKHKEQNYSFGNNSLQDDDQIKDLNEQNIAIRRTFSFQNNLQHTNQSDDINLLTPSINLNEHTQYYPQKYTKQESTERQNHTNKENLMRNTNQPQDKQQNDSLLI